MSDKKKERSLADELAIYGQRSYDGLRRGAREIGELAAMLEAKSPPAVRDGMEMVVENMPGFGVMESVRLGREAGGLWNQGRYADSLDRYADALDAPFNEIFWFLPGGGVVPKVMR